MTTVHGPRHWTQIQEAPRRYPIPLRLSYKSIAKHGPVYGFGQIRMISNKEIIFTAGDGLEQGMKAEIVVAWPCLLDDRIRLQLVLQVTITDSQDNVIEGRIRTHDFRTRRSEEVEQRAEPADASIPVFKHKLSTLRPAAPRKVKAARPRAEAQTRLIAF